MFGAAFSSRASSAFDEEEVRTLERLYALATEKAELSFPLDDDARRRLANLIVFTYRSAICPAATSTSDHEQRILEDCLQRFAPLQRAVSRALRRRPL